MFKDGTCVFCDDYFAKAPDESACIKLDCKYNEIVVFDGSCS